MTKREEHSLLLEIVMQRQQRFLSQFTKPKRVYIKNLNKEYNVDSWFIKPVMTNEEPTEDLLEWLLQYKDFDIKNVSMWCVNDDQTEGCYAHLHTVTILS